MGRNKRRISVLPVVLVICMLIFNCPITARATTNGKTIADAVAWATNHASNASVLDYDGAYGAQCVDLIKYYYVYLGNSAVTGNGKDYATNSLPSGWSRIQYTSGFVPQPGDIAVWTTGGGGYGHVAIVVSANASTMTVVEQNWVGKYCSSRSNASTSGIWGVIRPDFAPATNNPVGVLDSATGGVQSVTIGGWTYDKDDVNAQLQYHVYIGGPAGSADAICYGDLYANGYRPDVNTDVNHQGAGEYHGISAIIRTEKTGSQPVYVYGINVGSGVNALLDNCPITVNITADKEAPVISNVMISNITESGYTVSCTVTDNTGVNRVQFPTWTEPKQDDLNQNWGDSAACSGTKNGDTYTYQVKFSDHNNEKTRYVTHIYAYDNYGNVSSFGCGEVSAQYTISFNANGGTGAPASQTKTHDVALTLSSTKPTRSLYNFKGWATSSTATTAAYQAGGSFTTNANTTLYAVWEHVCANGHSYSYKVSASPTTSATGKLTGTCSKCSGTTTVTLPKLNTTDYSYKVVTAATCTANGTGRYTWKTTTYGNFYFDVAITKTGHNYKSVVTAPTCTAQGYTTYTCSTCGNTYKDSYTTALGHSYSYKVAATPTASAAGSLTGTCSRCSGTTTVTLPKLNTTDYTYKVIAAATCTTNGTGRYTWNTTSYGSCYFDVVLDKVEHAYQSVVTAPTCTEQGYTTYTCSSCGDNYTDTYVDALGHTEVIDEAVFSGCNEPYLTEGSHCSVCGEVLIAQVYQPATGHDYRSGVCIYCGETDPDYSTTNKIASGWSGDLTWVLTDDGVLTFSGTGAMKNYEYKSEMPWYKYIDQITSVVINEGATRIGDYAFYGMPKLETIDIADTVTYIGDFSFKGSIALDGVVLPPNLSNLGTSAFYGCTSLTSIEIPASLYTVKPYAFKNCSSLAKVTFHEGNLMKLSDGSFYGTALTEVEFPKCLDIIDVYCFKNCFDLASITIPEGDLTQIREAVFYATAIPSITIPEGVTKVGPYAFKNCVNLKTVSLPSTLTSVGEASFYACTGLQGITIPDAVTSIGDYAFRKCAAMTEVNLGRELTDIGLCGFYGCSGLTDLEIPDKVTNIQGYAFKGCTGLTSVNLGSSVETLGESAFHTCTALKTLELPASLKTIGDYCFSGSYNLWQLTFTGNAPTIGSGAFKGMDAYAYYPANDNTWTSAVMQNYGGDITWKVVGEEEPDDTVYVAEGTCGANATWTLDENGVLTVTGTGAMDEYSNTSKVPWAAYRSDINTVVINDGITEVGFNCFWKCINLENITIADSVTTLGKYAFAYSNKLESVVVPEGVTTFADSVFNGCKKLKNVTLPESLVSMGSAVFQDCISLEEIALPDSLTYVCSYTFDGCENLKTVELGQNTTWIGTEAFSVCEDLETIILPDSLTAIYDKAFQYCDKLSEVVLPSNLELLSDFCFYYCKALKNVEFGDKLTTIGERAFWGCDGIKEFRIPANVTTIGKNAFTRCGALTGIWVDENNPNYSNCAAGCLYNKDKSVILMTPVMLSGEFVIPESVTTIGEAAFSGCVNLDGVVLNDSVETIEKYAFVECKAMSEITIPASVNYIGSQAFLSCKNLSKITFMGDAPELNYGIFEKVTATVYYPYNNATWTEDIMHNYEGTITWVAVDAEGNPVATVSEDTEAVSEETTPVLTEAEVTETEETAVENVITTETEEISSEEDAASVAVSEASDSVTVSEIPSEETEIAETAVESE